MTDKRNTLNIKKLDPDVPLDRLDVVGFMESHGFTGLEAAFHLGMTPSERSQMAKAEPGDDIGDIGRALLTRLYSNYDYLLSEYDAPSFTRLLELMQTHLPKLTSRELAQILGATHQNGSRWMKGLDFKKPKIRRIARALQTVCYREGKEGLVKAIEVIIKEYEMQEREHSIRTIAELEVENDKSVLMDCVRKWLPAISEKEVAIICGAKTREGEAWFQSTDLFNERFKSRADELLAHANEKNSKSLEKYIRVRMKELKESGLSQHIRTIDKLKNSD